MSEEPATPTNGSNGSATMTATEVTGLVNLFNSMLVSMEGRLIDKMDDNAKAAGERWLKHDRELEANTRRVVERFEKIEKALLVVEQSLELHLDKEHDEDIAMAARVQPIKGVAAWFWRNWRDMVLLFIGILAASTFVVDWFTHTFPR